MPEITNKDYDRNVIKEGEESLFKTYYQPEDLPGKRRIRYVMQNLKVAPLMKVLDLGCGVGSFAFHSAKAGAMSYGVDYSEESIKMAELLCRKNNAKPDFIIADIAKTLPYDDDFFDRIVCVDFIEHITDKDKENVAREIKRMLKPGGHAVIFTPNLFRENTARLLKRLFSRHAENPLHFGLISRRKFERIMFAAGLRFRHHYYDVVRPFLSYIPGLRGVFALNLLWTVKK